MRNGEKTELARRLRQTSPKSEQRAWETLRQLRKFDLPVRRQHPIDHYIVDFAIVSKKLVIELDGSAHSIPGKAERDAEREAAIAALGWRVLRLPAKFGDAPDALAARVLEELRRQSAKPLTP